MRHDEGTLAGPGRPVKRATARHKERREDRYGRSSTVITTQIPTKLWHERLTDPTMADAICDRVIHNAHVISLKGPSIREKKGMLPDQKHTST